MHSSLLPILEAAILKRVITLVKYLKLSFDQQTLTIVCGTQTCWHISCFRYSEAFHDASQKWDAARDRVKVIEVKSPSFFFFLESIVHI